MRSGWTVRRSTMPAARARAKSRAIVASGAITRSTEEWEMSRSCHSATFSSAGTTWERTRRARPVRFSLSTGLRLWGMALEPFCPGWKNSSASRTSLRWRWRTSVASRSTPDAVTASAAKKAAWRSRGMTCVLTGSTCEAEAFGDEGLHARVHAGEGADRAGDGAGRDLGPRRDEAGAVALELGPVAGELQAEGGRLGVDAVAAADRGRAAVLPRALLQRREQGVEIGEEQVGGARQLHGEAGVEHVGGRHALVHEARALADPLRHPGQEGDDVVARGALDLVDARDVGFA